MKHSRIDQDNRALVLHASRKLPIRFLQAVLSFYEKFGWREIKDFY